GCSILTSSSAMRGGPYNPARAACEGPCASGRGETGRHAGFRCRWRKPWGFESLRPHSRHGQRAVDDDDRVTGEMDPVAAERGAHDAAARRGLQAGELVPPEAAAP